MQEGFRRMDDKDNEDREASEKKIYPNAANWTLKAEDERSSLSRGTKSSRTVKK